MAETVPGGGRPLGYEEFLARYTGVIVKGAEAWRATDPQEHDTGVRNAELALTAADARLPHYVDRAALLGPELGGTVSAEY